MSDIDVKPDTIAKPKIEQPRLYKVILINDDYTPREFVTAVLMMVFHMSEDQAYRIMMTAHQRGACVVAGLCPSFGIGETDPAAAAKLVKPGVPRVSGPGWAGPAPTA